MVYAIGIDLGTTNCCVAVVRNNRVVEVLENFDGGRTTPSVIGLKKDEIYIGKTAKKNMTIYPKNTIYAVKRLIGLKCGEEELRNLLQTLQYLVITNEEKLFILIDGKDENEQRFYLPEEISGILLKILKQQAEQRLDCNIADAVITVPSYFNNSQREATISAGKIAGFKNVNLLNEPTAAALYHGLDHGINERTILVYDFGGGTFDVSIIKYKNKVFEVLMIDGDINLGGEDIDNILVEYIKTELNIQYKSDINRRRIMARLKNVAEETKIELSSKTDADIEYTMEDTINLTRGKFNDLIKDIIARTMQIVDKCLNDEKMKNVKIDDILLVGGSTRIPLIEETLRTKYKFNIKRNTNADEAVALGAAIHAAKTFNNQFPELKTTNICQHSIGVEIEGGRMDVIIPKYAKLPVIKSKRYKTVNPNKNTIDIKMFCGDDRLTKNNYYLGQLRVSNITPDSTGSIILKETFEVDDNGVLNVTATDEGGQSKQMEVNINSSNLTSKEIECYSNRVNSDIIKSNKVVEFKDLKNKLEDKFKNNPHKLKWLKGLEYSEEYYDLLLEELQHYA